MSISPANNLTEEKPGAVIVSASASFRRRVKQTLPPLGWSVEEVTGGAEALARVESGGCQALFLDSWLPDLDVDELVKIVKTRYPDVVVSVIHPTSDGEPRGESKAEVNHPRIVVPAPQLRPAIDNRWRRPSANSPAIMALPAAWHKIEPLPGMVGTSAAMAGVYHLGRIVASRSTPVLITGETGTGKELVARAIHALSPRSKQPFGVVNCAAIPDTLLEAELFGYSRGAFTGAVQSRLGRIHSVHGGTLLLDEVGELPLHMQAKLLRFLQEGEVQRLGSDDVFRVDVRVIASTNADLLSRLRDGRFREDLYYRLMVFPIRLDPLRYHSEDTPLLAEHFLSLFCRQAGVAPKAISPAAIRLLQLYAWPGNVRELQHCIERALILAEDNPDLRPELFDLQSSSAS